MAQIQQDALRRTGSGRPDLLQRVLLDPIKDVGDGYSSLDEGRDGIRRDMDARVVTPIVPQNEKFIEPSPPMADVGAVDRNLGSQAARVVYLRDIGLLCLMGVVAGSLFGLIAGLSVFP